MSSIPDICESSVEEYRDHVADVAVIGAGFSGSLTALLLDRIGLKPVLVDRGRHPRFAIGESSTPMANLILEDLANRYQLPRLVPLTRYASWKRTYPQIVCGLKRGFSYFHHELDREFAPRTDHSNELLVAASESDEDADTHWLRSDFDGFLATEAVEAGILYFDHTSIDDLTFRDPVWELRLNRHSDDSPSKCDRRCLRVRFVIDASGDGTFLAQQLQIPSHPNGLRTRSRGLFSHFQNVEKWQDLYRDRGGRVNDHPYPCDAAALHHVFDGGWMWVLRFDNGITSAGFALDPDRFPLDLRIAPQEEWDILLRRLPAVAEQFRDAKAVIPFRRSGEMQRRCERASGANWAMLPNTAAFLDPLHSTGNALTLAGIERLVTILKTYWQKPQLNEELARYNTTVQTEIEFLDQIVRACYKGFCEFDRMVAMSMFYFAAATWSETQRRSQLSLSQSAFLNADHGPLRMALKKAYDEVHDSSYSTSDFVRHVREAIEPFNHVGLFECPVRNMYSYPSSASIK